MPKQAAENNRMNSCILTRMRAQWESTVLKFYFSPSLIGMYIVL